MLRIRSCTSIGTTGVARLNTTADCQVFVGELVDDCEHAESAAVIGAIPNEVPNQPLPLPDPFHPAVTDRPPRLAHQGGDLAQPQAQPPPNPSRSLNERWSI
jgi:hypothetical protein